MTCSISRQPQQLYYFLTVCRRTHYYRGCTLRGILLSTPLQRRPKAIDTGSSNRCLNTGSSWNRCRGRRSCWHRLSAYLRGRSGGRCRCRDGCCWCRRSRRCWRCRSSNLWGSAGKRQVRGSSRDCNCFGMR